MAENKKDLVKTGAETFLKAIPVGIANVIPGVSGGTIALLVGIYDRMMDAIGNFFKRFLDKETRWPTVFFLVMLILGAGGGILGFSKLITLALNNGGTLPLYACFTGLIAGSVPFIMKIHPDMKMSLSRISMGVVGFLMVLVLILASEAREVKEEARLSAVTTPTTDYIYGDMPSNSAEEITVAEALERSGELEELPSGLSYYIWLSFCGFLAAGSMIVPGFSGSALLVALGEWMNVMRFLDGLVIVPILFLGVGAVLGVFLFAKLISFCLKKFPAQTYYFILGLIFASFYQIWLEAQPAFQSAGGGIWAISAVLLFGGFFGAFFMPKLGTA